LGGIPLIVKTLGKTQPARLGNRIAIEIRELFPFGKTTDLL
jgi:hypothetical protein